MRIIYTFVVSVIALTQIFAQQPELFIDYNQGATHSFSSAQSAYLGDDIIMIVIGEDIGEEPAIISNGQFSVLKDINPGELDSDPQSFISYNGYVYFTAKDEESGYAVWKTDGTPEGTIIEFQLENEPNARPKSFTIAEDGGMYYNYDNLIIRTDGTEHKVVFTGGYLTYDFANASSAYGPYKDGIAFMGKNSDDTYSLVYVNENESTVLAITEDTGFFGDAIGVAEIEGGIMFTLYDSDYDGVYIYKEVDQSLTPYMIDGVNLPSRRTIDFTREKNIAWISTKGYYSINGVNGEEELLFERDNNAAGQGEEIQFAIHDDKVAFVVDEGLFGDHFIIHSDGTSSGTSSLIELQSYYSDMITFGKYAIIADGTSNLFDPKIRLVNIEDGTVQTIFEDSNSSNNISSLKPVGVQDEYLYYIYKLDTTVGIELFRIKLDGVTSAEEIKLPELEFNVIQNDRNITIQLDDTKNIDVSLFNQSGQLIYHGLHLSNVPFTLPEGNGLFWLNIREDNKFGVKQISLF